MSHRLEWRALASAALALVLASSVCGAELFETPADEPPSASLSAGQMSGPSFHVEAPVHSDGLMHRYVIDSRFGTFSAYGIDALNARLREIAALTTLATTSEGQVVLDSVMRGMHDQAKAVVRVAVHPVGTIIGIPAGIGHLLGGYRAEAEEVTGEVTRTVASSRASSASEPKEGRLARAGASATHAARSGADRYIGISAAEHRWYEKLGVDPYTDNVVLRRAVARLAKVDAAASLGMRFAPVGIPFAGEMQRALDAIDREDPAVLRKRRREALLRVGLSAEEVEHFEHTPLLTPTRQTLLAEALQSFNGVDGRAELVRHAMTVQSEEETEVFLNSVLLLERFHAHQPVVRILKGVRIPAAELAGGRIVVFGAFDAVEWTQEVAAYEQSLREALPHEEARELWISGTVSPLARAALEERGWSVHDGAQAAVVMTTR